MKTPHISVRVPGEQLEIWRAECETSGVDVSSQIRTLMDAWVRTMSLKREYEELAVGEFA